MAKLEVSTDLPLEPHVTWVRASDLHGFDEWLTIHDGWRSDLPGELVVGTTAESVVSVKGMRNRVAWTVREIDSPHHLVLHGAGKGGTRFKLRMSVRGVEIGSVLTLHIDLGGAPLFGPIGSGVARALHGDIEASLRRFVELYG